MNKWLLKMLIASWRHWFVQSRLTISDLSVSLQRGFNAFPDDASASRASLGPVEEERT